MTQPRSARVFKETAVWGEAPGGVRFAGPNGPTVDPDGHVYSTEFQGGHLRKFTPDGILQFEVGGPGTEPGMLANPIGVPVTGAGNVWGADYANERVQVSSRDSKLVGVFENDLCLADTANGAIRTFIRSEDR